MNFTAIHTMPEAEMLGCMHGTGHELDVFLYSLLIIWLACLGFLILNPILIAKSKGGGPFRNVNFAIWAAYSLVALALVTGVLLESPWGILAVFGVPLSAVIHFAYLLIARRKFRQAPTPPLAEHPGTVSGP